jgi:hypothetical protein
MFSNNISTIFYKEVTSPKSLLVHTKKNILKTKIMETFSKLPVFFLFLLNLEEENFDLIRVPVIYL